MGTYSYIWAVDPGSVATGVAAVHRENPEYHQAMQFEDPVDALQFVASRVDSVDTVLIEMYRSAGYLNNHAKATLEVVGAFKYITRLWGMKPLLVVEQSRLSGQREASDLMNGTVATLRMDPNKKDAFSALSHACAYRRRISNG